MSIVIIQPSIPYWVDLSSNSCYTMGHMKKLLTLVTLGLLFAFASPISAHEGSIDLTNAEVSCKGISLYQSGYYRVFGRCDGLVYPHETTYNKYVLWGKTTARGEMIRVAEVDKGYFSGNIASPFEGMTITAETDGLVRRPSDKVVVSGKVTVFDFDKSKVTTSTTATTPSASTSTTGTTVQNAGEKVSSATSTAGSVVGRILTSLLVIILVIVGLAIGASLIFRNRGSVSH